MKKVGALLLALVLCVSSVFAAGSCKFTDDYAKQVLYFDAWQYLEYYYNLDEELMEVVCEYVAESALNPDMPYDIALANCVEFHLALNR